MGTYWKPLGRTGGEEEEEEVEEEEEEEEREAGLRRRADFHPE